MLEAKLDEVNLYVLLYRNKTTMEGAFRALLEDPFILHRREIKRARSSI